MQFLSATIINTTTSTYNEGMFQPLSYQCRVRLDSSFRCTRSNVELKPTRYFTVFCVGFA